ncbi:MAG: complex I NDUFA9 subunit family protein [Pseudomonadota bacterium]
MVPRQITIFGGSGFIGRYVVQRLADDGWRIVVAGRDPEAALFLKPLGDVGQIVPIAANVGDQASVEAAIHGSEAVINLVGILYQRGRQNFARTHVEAARHIANAAKSHGVERLIQISAIGASEDSPSTYATSKAEAEKIVRKTFPAATIIRPSIVFGPEDGFFNLFAKLAVMSPILPLFGGGKTRFQPVYVCDVASAIVACLDDPATQGQTFELGGPTVYSFRDLMKIVVRETQRRCALLPLPYAVAHLQALFLQFMPVPLVTPDQVRLMQIDNVVSGNQPGLADLGINPTTVEVIVPTYLAQYRRGGLKGRPKFG